MTSTPLRRMNGVGEQPNASERTPSPRRSLKCEAAPSPLLVEAAVTLAFLPHHPSLACQRCSRARSTAVEPSRVYFSWTRAGNDGTSLYCELRRREGGTTIVVG